MSFDLQILNNDLVIQGDALATVSGTDKLVQDLLKIALTEAGANFLAPWYGSLISRTLIGSYLDSDMVISVATSQLQNSIDNLKNLQNIQVSSGQKVTPDEQIAVIKNISITRSTIDYRNYRVSINVLNRAFGKIAASFAVNNM